MQVLRRVVSPCSTCSAARQLVLHGKHRTDDLSGGCQLQPLPYQLQLAHKKKTVQLAYERFSGLRSDEVPAVKDTIASPKQWGYRTKITPHFDAPPKWARAAVEAKGKPEVKLGQNQTEANAGMVGGDGADGAVGGEEEMMNEEEVGLNGSKEEVGEALGAANGGVEAEKEESAVNGEKKEWECRIGFERKGRPGVMDIEVSHEVSIPTVTRSLQFPGRSAEPVGMPYRYARSQ